MSKTIEVALVPGDTVYALYGEEVIPLRVAFIYVAKRNRYYASNGSMRINFREPGIGRDVFLTLEEAEAKLAKVLSGEETYSLDRVTQA